MTYLDAPPGRAPFPDHPAAYALTDHEPGVRR
jgi:hypothetical protein